VTRQKRYHVRKPWVKFVCWAQNRCKSNDPKRAPYYKEKGITCSLTVDEAEILWVRDRAGKMTKPSLDRKDSTLGYHFENCRFREFGLNVRGPHDPVAQAALDAELAACADESGFV
jgi:hypothetical protein